MNESEIREVAQLARAAGRPVALTLNGRYTTSQMGHVRDLAGLWEAAGGTAVIVADPVCPSIVAVTVAEPTATAVTHPSLLRSKWRPMWSSSSR